MTDFTLAITAHSETVVAGPTIHSARAALAPLIARGLSVQLLMGLDSCTEDCRAFMTQPDLDDFERHEFTFRDQGQTRNALVERATGEFLAFLDADDLFSENWLSVCYDMLGAARDAGQKTIIHPELNWQFDGINHVYSNPAQDHAFFSPHVLATANYYDAMCAAPTDLWRTLPYPDRAVAQGFAFEDYQWFVEATALGWTHAVGPDTIIFKRRRDSSQTSESRGNNVLIRAIDALAIDNLGHPNLARTHTSD